MKHLIPSPEWGKMMPFTDSLLETSGDSTREALVNKYTLLQQ